MPFRPLANLYRLSRPWAAAFLAFMLLAGLVRSHPAQAQTSSDSIIVYAGQSRVVRFPYPIRRVAVADAGISDFRVISAQEVYLLGKTLGRTSVQLWSRDGQSFTYLVDVVIDPEPLRGQILAALPDETGIQINAAAGSLIVAGSASDGVAAEAIRKIARGYAAILSRQLSRNESEGGGGGSGGGQQGLPTIEVIDRLSLRDMRQVKLEVRIAEVSKSLIDRLGLTWLPGRLAATCAGRSAPASLVRVAVRPAWASLPAILPSRSILMRRPGAASSRSLPSRRSSR